MKLELLESRYLKKEDVSDELIVTICGLERKNLALADQVPENKWVMKFEELEKPLVMNTTNLRLCAKFFGDETRDWMGKEVVLYVDDSVSYGGQLVGGIRIRAKRPAQKKNAAVTDVNTALNEMADDIPM